MASKDIWFDRGAYIEALSLIHLTEGFHKETGPVPDEVIQEVRARVEEIVAGANVTNVLLALALVAGGITAGTAHLQNCSFGDVLVETDADLASAVIDDESSL